MLAALVAVGALLGGEEGDGDGGDGGGSRQQPPVDVRRVAERVERIRGLEFEELPPVRVVSAEQAREEGLAELDRDYPAERREADVTVLELLGLVPPETDLRELAGTIFGEEVAGYYDDRRKRMTLVADAFEGDAEGSELTLAHELVHALEDQHFGLDVESALDDEAVARQALFEGTATVAMLDYAMRFVGGARAADRTVLLEALAVADLLGIGGDLPPYIQRALVFPYVAGARFIDSIGTWGPANRALRGRPPVSTEQVLHPQKYHAGERPRSALGRPHPGTGWVSRAAGTLGEFDTRELVRSSDSPRRAARAAAGWGGGRYELWERRGQHVLVAAWRWDSPRDAAEFAAALPRYVESTLGGRAQASGVWRADGGRFVATRAGATVRLVIGPSAELVTELRD